MAFVKRVGIEPMIQWLEAYRWLTDAVRGEDPAVSGEPAPIDWYSEIPAVPFYGHLSRAIAAAIFNDSASLRHHTAAAMESLPFALGNYVTAVARLLRGLALAAYARTVAADERPALLAELEELKRWLAARAEKAPMNFMHMLRLLEAEQAWAAGDVGTAALAFDAARDEVAARQRPWHRALISECAARLTLHRVCDTSALNFSPRPARNT